MFPNRSLKSTPTRYQAQPACRGTYVHRSRPSLSLSPRASPTTTDAAAKIDLIGLITQSIGFDRSAPIRSTSHCLWIPETKSRGPSRRPPRPLLRWRWLPFFIRFAQSMLLLLVCCPTWDAGPDTRPRPSRAGGTWAPVVERLPDSIRPLPGARWHRPHQNPRSIDARRHRESFSFPPFR